MTYYWDFDDGTFSNEQNPIHTFTGNEDKYKVELEIITANGCDDKENDNGQNNMQIQNDSLIIFKYCKQL